eukprot:gene5825-4152_t
MCAITILFLIVVFLLFFNLMKLLSYFLSSCLQYFKDYEAKNEKRILSAIPSLDYIFLSPEKKRTNCLIMLIVPCLEQIYNVIYKVIYQEGGINIIDLFSNERNTFFSDYTRTKESFWYLIYLFIRFIYFFIY